jgi:hypothetical protein
MMEDFTLEWDENGDDKTEKNLEPVKLDSMAIVPPPPPAPAKAAVPSVPAAPAAPASSVPPATTGN